MKLPVLIKHNPKYSFPCKECINLCRNCRGEGYDFCVLLEIWIHPDLANEITCNARVKVTACGEDDSEVD